MENITNNINDTLFSFFMKLDKKLQDTEIMEIWENRQHRKYKLRTWIDECVYPKLEHFVPLNNEQRNRELNRNNFYLRAINNISVCIESKNYKQIKQEITDIFIIDGNKNIGLYVFGDIGAGKTTLITAICGLLLIFLKLDIRYITMPNLLRLLTSIESDDKEYINKLKKINLLVIDDFGLEHFATEHQESVARDFFSYRYGNELPIFLCGNEDIRKKSNKNMFYKQIADYLNDTSAFSLYELSGKSRRK